jgi:phosphoglycerate dehydrogenase-like enzyme
MRETVEIKFLAKPIAEASDEEVSGAQFLMAIRERTALNDAVFEKLPHLKLILQTGGHAYHIDAEAAKKRGIAIALGRRVKAPLLSVPELTIAMCLGAVHLLPQAQAAMRSGGWPLLTGRTLSGRRLGILGMGRHGSRVADIAKKAFSMEVVAWDRTEEKDPVRKELERQGGENGQGEATGQGGAKGQGGMDVPGRTNEPGEVIPRVPLDELLATSDIVSIHLRLSPESTQLLNADRLSRMKRGAILINTSRGAIVDETALVESLQQGRLSGAGLDVFEQEPLAANSPLRTLPNVLLTPHIGWTVEEVFEEFARIACTQLKEWLAGTLAASELY